MERLLEQKLEQLEARKSESGFTLVELAIVLVIIGLIIGGVLVGQDLIKAAEIRATISQLESYNAAVNTFRGRYNGIPGDIRNATEYFDTQVWENMQNGDGDRLLESCDDDTDASNGGATSQTTGLCADSDGRNAFDLMNGEITQFWHHLSAAELVPGFFDGLSCVVTGTGCAPNGPGTVDVTFPRVKLDRNGIGAFGTLGRNYYQLGTADSGANGDDTFTTADSLTPVEAESLDQKVDDGRPNTGSVRAMGGTGPYEILVDAEAADTEAASAPSDTANYDAAFCVWNTVGGDAGASAVTAQYAVLNPEVACQMVFRMN